mmetsp:Transcript_4735/g.5687  ORF Transcript_4735/g.5687 Transcript_4735/m.5687 type:complete len:153 (-) Transcript_4735:127-585(-)|eukprot:CAMPEP_0194361026 /NCGR_PEP_ID=MMETSP0174-20130528/8536_1 /TAXON_ID=216777 /ORGANISM="Proboscia alata, Strain PI-D3" /LENGTH=152 /DNA_ID=CAMNT_0039132957 /DNA_START=131 /DNA_END=589 /DNA_ORIENTATION=+
MQSHWKIEDQDQQPQSAMMLLVCSNHCPEELQIQMLYLDGMGFSDKSTMLRALVLANGDLNRAVEFLLDGSITLPQPINGDSPIELQLKQDGFQLLPLQQSHGQQIQHQQYLLTEKEGLQCQQQTPSHSIQIKQEGVLRIKQEEETSNRMMV